MPPRRSAIARRPRIPPHEQTREHDQRQRESGAVLGIAIQTRASHEHRDDFRARMRFLARTASLMRALSCSLRTNLPVATGTSAAEITATAAESSVGRPAAPTTSAATVPGPVVGPTSALPAAGCAQHLNGIEGRL